MTTSGLLVCLVLLPLLLGAAPSSAAPTPDRIPLWQRFETSFESDKDYKNALQVVQIAVDLTAPSGGKTTIDAFWDGGRTFRMRFSPGEVGAWRYTTRASDTANAGLHGRSGGFTCVAAKATNPLYAHGPVRVSDDRFHLVHADGTPFFWLGDTAWAGPMLSTDKDWQAFLHDRKAKRFNVVQVMATQNIAAAGDASGRQAFFLDGDKMGLEPAFWRRLDRRFDAANHQGLVVSPSFSWAARWAPAGKALDPGALLPERELVLLLRYAQARYGAHHIAWLFGGDIDYSPEADKWKRIGRLVFGDKPRQVVTMHPAPRKLHHADFKGEPWLGFLGYQSSHSNNENTHRWMTEGEPATAWKLEPRYPVINIEPNYEAHMDGHHKRPMDALDIRRSAYWSVLVSPTAGVSYGAHGVWSWESEPNVPMSHPKTGVAPPWFQAMKLPGSAQMKILVDLFTAKGRPWWKLRPAPELVVGQPGKADASRFVSAARTEDGKLVVAYVPAGPVTLDLSALPATARTSVVDPTSGRAAPAGGVKGGGKATITTGARNAGGSTDFVVIIEAK